MRRTSLSTWPLASRWRVSGASPTAFPPSYGEGVSTSRRASNPNAPASWAGSHVYPAGEDGGHRDLNHSYGGGGGGGGSSAGRRFRSPSREPGRGGVDDLFATQEETPLLPRLTRTDSNASAAPGELGESARRQKLDKQLVPAETLAGAFPPLGPLRTTSSASISGTVGKRARARSSARRAASNAQEPPARLVRVDAMETGGADGVDGVLTDPPLLAGSSNPPSLP
jgi:hypothetical protein